MRTLSNDDAPRKTYQLRISFIAPQNFSGLLNDNISFKQIDLQNARLTKESQITIVWSSLTDANFEPSGENATALIVASCWRRVYMHRAALDLALMSYMRMV